MHLFFYVRGILHQVEVFKILAQSQYWKWRRINKKTGKGEIVLSQGSLRPSIFGAWEYVFPKESLANVLSIFQISQEGIDGVPFMNKVRLLALRKMFSVKKIPKEALKEAAKLFPTIMFDNCERGLSSLRIPGLAIYPIGIKEDKTIEMFDPESKKTFIQEGL